MSLKKIRQSKNFTQCKVAKEVGISLSYYSQIENRKRRPSVQIAKKIGQVLNYDWTRFYDVGDKIEG